jgi:hypothetical protein
LKIIGHGNPDNNLESPCILVGKPEWKRLLGRRGCRWEGDIRMNLREIGSENVDWMHLSEGRDR